MPRSLIASLFLLTLPACPSSTAVDGGLDAPRADLDAPALDAFALDGPVLTDVPVMDDAPSSMSDVPSAMTDAPMTDAPGLCDGLAPAACLGAGCVPSFDDACCSLCTDGPCADCTNPTYLACVPTGASPCTPGTGCGLAPAWSCNDVAADCSAAAVIDLDSCTVTGCVPSYPSGEGAPVLADGVCVAIVAESCTVSCRRVAPPCPTGMVPEGDGFCYTDRCIPTFVCAS